MYFVRRFDSAKWVQTVHTKSQNSTLSILKFVTFNRKASKLQEKVRYLPETDRYILSHYCRSGGHGCLICKFKTYRAVIGRGRKTFNLRSTTMDLFGRIFIKALAAIPKSNACIGNKMNVKYAKKKEIIFCSRLNKNF